jgi:L-ascorbate peroxidase
VATQFPEFYFIPLISYVAAGLATAVKMLEPIKAKYPLVGYADLFQMASAVAVEMVRPLLHAH